MRRSAPDQPVALWVVPVSNLAGVARHVIDVARVGLPGWSLVVAAPEGPLLDEVRAHGVEVVPVGIGPGVRLDRAVRAFRGLVRRVRPQVVHTHLARADLLAAMATPGLPVRLVSTEHHIPPDRFMFHPTLARAKAKETVHHHRLKRFDRLIAVSASTRRDMLTYWRPQQPVTVILNGVDRPVVAPVRGAGLRFLSLARLSPEKNIELTLRAFARIRAAEPTATLTIGGTGESEAGLRHLADELGVAADVDFAGFINAEQAMADHDVVLQPSRSDNCSYTLLDAVAAGMGVAASPIGGNPEILPAHCIAELEDLDGFVRVALEQAQRPDRRPTLPDEVPTVAGMAARIVGEYAQVPRPRRWR
ncbi:glycosyltransferase family 4 protein [Aestuariimicrobium sp. Y1814]|uniref:glycosyltransferase family 4 protein n=1 Tax=Aestuariimicrobium sp. Y1814 TaxID=3418742 RepID=UPI003DA72180